MEQIFIFRKTYPNIVGLILADRKNFFKPKNTEQLIEFLININNSQKITCLGAGSNTLIRDGGFEGAVIKLSPSFSFINLFNNETLEVGAGTLDKTLSRFGADNSITNYEFLSCIPLVQLVELLE